MEKNDNNVVVTVHVEDDKSVSIVEEKIATPKLVAKRYEFQSSSSSLLGADLSSSTSSLLMAPPKLNTVKKSRILVNPGKSMVEWMKIQRQLEGKGSNDNKLLRKIGPDELASHNTVGDVWMAINDRVFDISDYANYHPGGVEEIMKGAGQDATTLFNQIHKWVNFASILRGNFMGFLVKEPTLAVVRKSNYNSRDYDGFSSLVPSTKFSEDDDSVFLEIDSQMVGDVRQESWTVGLLNRERLILKIMGKPPKVWTSHLRLLKELTDDHINVDYENNFKRILITLKKPRQQERWLKLGSPLTDHNLFTDSRTTIEDLYPTQFFKKQRLTHNSYLFTAVTHHAVIGVPLGFHVQISLKNNVTRPYTPIILSITDTAEDAKKDNDDIDDSNNKSIVSQNSQELHFIIKIYPDGEFTSLLEKMFSENDSEENSSIEVEMGFPRGNFDTLFFQNVDILCLFAAGTGITPFIKIIQYLYVRRKSIPIQKVVLLFFNETCEDVIWTQEFETLAKNEPSWFYFYPVISKPNKSSSETEWNGLTGRISIQLFENCLKSIPLSTLTSSSKAIICGSYGFNAACKEVIKAQSVLKFDDPDGIFIFNG